MERTLYALFESIDRAKEAVGELIRAGAHPDDLTIVCRRPDGDHFHQIGNSPPAPAAAPNGREIERDLDVGRKRARTLESAVDRGEGPASNEEYRDHPEIRARGAEPPDVVAEDQTLGAMPETVSGLRTPGPGAEPHADGFSSATGTRYAGIAATAGASANPGGMTDYLWDSLPIDVVPLYRKDYDDGKAIVFVRNANDEAREVLLRKDPARLDGQGYLA